MAHEKWEIEVSTLTQNVVVATASWICSASNEFVRNFTCKTFRIVSLTNPGCELRYLRWVCITLTQCALVLDCIQNVSKVISKVAIQKASCTPSKNARSYISQLLFRLSSCLEVNEKKIAKFESLIEKTVAEIEQTVEVCTSIEFEINLTNLFRFWNRVLLNEIC